MWKKIWAWIKKYSHLIIAGIGTSAGFVLGICLGRNSPNIQRIKDLNKQLEDRIVVLSERLGYIEKLNKLGDEQIRHLRDDLETARTSLDRLQERINTSQGGLQDIEDGYIKLDEWIQKYGKELEAIQGDR